VADFSGTPNTGISPLTVNFTDLSIGEVTGWSWDFDNDGTEDSVLQNPSHVYAAPGNYTVSLTVTDIDGPVTETKIDYITVTDPPPIADFSADPVIGDKPLTVQFTDLSTGTVTEWSWDFDGDGLEDSSIQSPLYTYNTAGTYTVSLTVTGPGGADTITKTDHITINEPAPIAEFSGSPTNGIAPLTVNFTDLSAGNVTGWSWDFDNDGTEDTNIQNPVYTFNTPGTFTVALTVTGPGGISTETKTDYIIVADPPPVAEFSGTPTSGIAPLIVSFSDLSTGNVTSWSWDFDGDGLEDSTESNPTYTYNAAGTYAVSLTVTGPGGASTETKTDYITVNDPPPVAVFTATPLSGIAPLTVNFTDLSTGPIDTWSWDFDNDGTPDSTEQNPSFTYNAVGTYAVSLTVTGPGGSDTVTQSGYITVADPPPMAVFSANPTVGTEPLTVNFEDLSTGEITTWSWDFDNDDVEDSAEQNPTYTFSAAGVYTVKLTVIGPGGSSTETKIDYITVNDYVITLQWDANSEEDLAGYKVYYKIGSYGPPYDGTDADQGPSPIRVAMEDLTDPDNPEFRLTGIDPDQIYFFAVTAYNNEDPELAVSMRTAAITRPIYWQERPFPGRMWRFLPEKHLWV
jgi:PKD repeat protein